MKKVAFITGVTGQDGSYLSELLLSKGYIVHGLKRRSSSFNTDRINHLYENKNFFLHYGDVTDPTNLFKIIKKIKPHEVYNLAAQSHVQVSFESPEYTANADALGALRILEAIKILDCEIKFYQASTSEMFGNVLETPQKETTPFYPRSPYGVAKLYAHWITKNYRESYNMYNCSGILFNHESPRRGETFVTKKITMGVANIYKKNQKKIILGNLDAERDWGHAKDYVKGMWLMMQQKKPDDYILATNKKNTVRKFVELAFKNIDVELKWEGKGLKEKGLNSKTKEVLVEMDKKYLRPSEVPILIGDYSKAKKDLGWAPTYFLEELCKEMVESDLKNDK